MAASFGDNRWISTGSAAVAPRWQSTGKLPSAFLIFDFCLDYFYGRQAVLPYLAVERVLELDGEVEEEIAAPEILLDVS